MRYSPEPTKWIAVKVNTNSDYDTIDFAIVHLTDAYLNTLEQRIQAAHPFATDPTFNHLDFDDDNIKFYNWDEVNDDLGEIENILEDQESCYVAIDDDFDFELNFSIPEQKLDTHSMRMHSSGAFNYVCYDQNGDEYYTDGISL